LRLRQGLAASVADLPAKEAAAPATVSGGVDARPGSGGAHAVRAGSSQLDTVRVRERGDWLAALSLARNLRHLGYPHRALDRYRLALEADPHAAFTRDAMAELAAVAIALGDSAVLGDQFRWIAARPDAARHTDSLGRLLAARLAWAPGPETQEFADRLETLASEPNALAWLAVARARQAAGRFEDALAAFRRMLALRVLAPQQFAGVARGMGDCFFALGRHSDARALYGELRRRDIGESSSWATYQIGRIDSLAGDHQAAAHAFRVVCEQRQATPWQQEACWQLRDAEHLLDTAASPPADAALSASATAPGGGS
jgi:tetratricopeptide (TPR) repeat protein